jgi:hypothetical protein
LSAARSFASLCRICGSSFKELKCDMIRHQSTTLSILAVLFIGVLAWASEPMPRDNAAVQKVVTQALDAMKAADWLKFASLMHPDALRDFKETLAQALEATESDPDEMRQAMRFFGNPKSVKELLALSPEKFFARFLEGITTTAPRLRQVLTGSEYKVIGTVYENDGTAHVVYRTHVKVEGTAASAVGVISLKRDGDSWRMLMSADFKALAEQVRRALKK